MVFNQDNHDFFVRATKSIGIQLRFLMTYELSIAIQKSIDFDGFLDGVDFVRLFSEKYKYYSHPTISHKPLRFCHSLSNPCLPSFVHVMLSSSFSLSNSSNVYNCLWCLVFFFFWHDFLSSFFYLSKFLFLLIDNFFLPIC